MTPELSDNLLRFQRLFPEKTAAWEQELIELRDLLPCQSSLFLAIKYACDFWFRRFKCLLRIGPRVSEQSSISSEDYILPLSSNASGPYGQISVDSKFIEGQTEAAYFLLGLHSILGQLTRTFEASSSAPKYQDFLSLCFSKIPWAAAILRAGGESVLHANPSFWRLKLGVSLLKDLKHHQIFESETENLLVLRWNGTIEDTVREVDFLLCLPLGLKTKFVLQNSTKDELGIITSSLAHELNNPLAGILAAVECLLLADPDNQTKETLSNIYSTAGRAKSLVELFLGFSRPSLSPSRAKDDSDQISFFETGKAKDYELPQLFEQAMTLARLRIAQSHFNLSFSAERLNQYGAQFNASMMTMVFYLMIHEILTCFAHQKLVRSEKRHRSNLVLTEDSAGFTISVDDEVNLEKQISENSLMGYLLTELKLEMSFSANGIKFDHSFT